MKNLNKRVSELLHDPVDEEEPQPLTVRRVLLTSLTILAAFYVLLTAALVLTNK